MVHHAVIGANFGDEGKGRTVDYLVSQAQERPLVVRYNSGSQAGHTVQVGETRHIFSHIGSGALRGADTLLCHKFVANPVRFNQEYDQLVAKGFTPKVYVDKNLRVSTPLDVLLNQIQEMARGTARHGSCGMGFGETILRYEKGFNHTWNSYAELGSYFLQTMIQRGIAPDPQSIQGKVVHALMMGKFNWDKFEHEMNTMLERVELVDASDYLLSRDLIFEGAQGLKLHQDHHYFPHVTRCRTGIEDMVELMSRVKLLDRVTVHYCTRPYLTRHGAGPMCNELPNKPYDEIEDPTNIPNEYQGSLRFGHLNLDTLRQDIDHDLRAGYNIDMGTDIRWKLSMSCCDQVPLVVDVIKDGYVQKMGVPHIARAVDILGGLMGYSPDSKDTVDLR